MATDALDDYCMTKHDESGNMSREDGVFDTRRLVRTSEATQLFAAAERKGEDEALSDDESFSTTIRRWHCVHCIYKYTLKDWTEVTRTPAS